MYSWSNSAGLSDAGRLPICWSLSEWRNNKHDMIAYLVNLHSTFFTFGLTFLIHTLIVTTFLIVTISITIIIYSSSYQMQETYYVTWVGSFSMFKFIFLHVHINLGTFVQGKLSVCHYCALGVNNRIFIVVSVGTKNT